MEATALYWLSIYSFLYNYNFYAINVINPIQSAGNLKHKVICVLNQVFPEYQTIFSNTLGTTSKQLLLDFSSNYFSFFNLKFSHFYFKEKSTTFAMLFSLFHVFLLL